MHVAGGRFGALYAVVGAIVLFQLATALASEIRPFSHTQALGVMVGVLLLTVLVLFVPLGSGGLISRTWMRAAGELSWLLRYSLHVQQAFPMIFHSH